MQLHQVKGNHLIDGVSRMPEATEDGKFRKWNNTTGVFDYVDIHDWNISNVTTVDNIVTITRNDGTTWQIVLPNSPDDFGLGLPGDSKVLFDNNNSIDGSDKFKYDYINDRILLTNGKGLFGKDDNFDTSHKNILQYLGNNNLFLNNVDSKALFSATATAKNTIAIGRQALSNIQTQTTLNTADNNIAIGIYAGASTNKGDNVFIGAYAGRLEPDGNKLYIHNTDFASVSEFRDNSLLYGEFDLGILHVNNRLDVSEEIQIGAFDVANTPGAGMIQFIDIGGGLVKPQYYDSTQWIDFASNSNYYLTGITNVDDEYTFEINGSPNVVHTFPNTYYPSSGIGNRIQISNGDNTFTHDDALTWSNTTLNIDGAMLLSPKGLGDFVASEGLTINTGTHVYMYIDGAYRQLDNEATSGEANKGENVGGEIGVYADFNTVNKNLQFYTLRPNPADPRITIAQNTGNSTIDFDLDYTITGTNAGATGTGLIKAVTGGTNAVLTDIAIKKLHSSDNSVIITAYTDYVDLQATGTGGGEINTGLNIGGYREVFESKQGSALQFRTLNPTQNLTITQQATTLDVSVDSFVNNAANISGGINIFKDYTETSGKRTLNLRPLSGIDGINIALNGDVIEAGINVSIPSITTIPTPVWTSGDRTLTWNISYDDNILDGTGAVSTPISAIKLGDNLIYDSGSNTLNATGGLVGGGNPLIAINNNTIVRDVNGFVDRDVSNKQVDFTLDDASVIAYPTTQDAVSGLGWLAFEDEYKPATDTEYGIVKLGSNIFVNGDGDLEVTIPDVTVHDYVGFYPMQYSLHDTDNVGNEDTPPTGSPIEPINDRRDRARANIGAAYVNGSNEEPMIASIMHVNTIGSYKDGWNGEDSGLILWDNKIRSDWGTTEIVKTKDSDDDNSIEATKIAIGNGKIDIILDSRDLAGGVGDVNVYMYDISGTKKRVAKLSGRYESGRGLVADFEISGNFTYRSNNL